MQGVQPRPNRKPSSGAAASPTAGTWWTRTVALEQRDQPDEGEAEQDGQRRRARRVSWLRRSRPARRRPPRTAPPSSTKTTEKPSTNSSDAGEHPAAAGVARGRRRTGRWRRRGSRAAAGSRTGRRTRPAPRPARPGSRAPASPEAAVLAGTTHPSAPTRFSTSCTSVGSGSGRRGQRADDARAAGRGPAGVEHHGARDRVGRERAAEGQQRLAARARRTTGRCTPKLRDEGLAPAPCSASRMLIPTKCDAGRRAASAAATSVGRLGAAGRAPRAPDRAPRRLAAAVEPARRSLPSRSLPVSDTGVAAVGGRRPAVIAAVAGDVALVAGALTATSSPPAASGSQASSDSTADQRSGARSGPLLLGGAAGRERRRACRATGIRSPAGSE